MKKSSKSIAYFCMEYGLTSEFKIYSGGLGILAGDIVKSSYAMNKPTVFIGILWQNGYNTQVIDQNCNVIDKTPHNEWQQYVIDTGKYTEVMVEGRKVLIKIWKYKDYPLFLLDTNLSQNEKYAGITANLYGDGGCFGDEKSERIAQEIVLGVGGIKALDVLGISADVYHFNDGHPLFGALELISREKWYGHTFEEAIDIVNKRIVFTTHTPVKAGNESHDINTLIRMGANCFQSYDELKEIGGFPFNMTIAALRLSHIVNAVAKRNAEISQRIHEQVKGAAPIIAITNGVHQGTWQDPLIDKAFKKRSLSDIYDRHMINKENLINEVYRKTHVMLDKNKIIFGFARRATEYKRWSLIFRDINRLDNLINDHGIKDHGIQIVFAGKSHKNDTKGKNYISFINQMCKKYPNNMVFLEDYNMDLSKIIVTGCDVWLNTPRAPFEACGTSGMKAAANGVLNVSIPDGWWAEACIDEVNGWNFGSQGTINPDGEQANYDEQDDEDAKALYDVLENKVLPTFYNKVDWSLMMYESIFTFMSSFTSDRMVEDYHINLYNC